MTAFTQKLVIGIAVVVLLCAFVVGVLMGAVVYEWKAAQRAGDEAAAQQNLKTIAAVEIQYFNTHTRTFGTFDEMVKEAMLSNRFSGELPVLEHYIYTLKVTPKMASGRVSYTLNADPQSDATGRKHFYIDSNSSTIHFNPDQPSGATDPPIGE
jgi:type II secretory pathway pseudopilin PulG